MSYPHLFPSGFIEFQDPCSGPTLYRNQPSREANGVRLNEFMNKYVTGEYKDGDFIRMATNMKQFARTWTKLPGHLQKEFIDLLKQSDSELGEELRSKQKSGVENFGDGEPVEMVNKFIEEMKSTNPEYENVKAITTDNRMSIFIIVVVAIVAVFIGFLVATIGK